MLTRDFVQGTLSAFASTYPEDHDKVSELMSLVEACPDSTSRSEFRGHITCSGAILADNETVWQIRHATLDRWVFPGGHIEATDDTFLDAVLREIEEEVGVQAARLEPITSVPFDLDRHPIPENPRRGEPAHEHWDLRFAFRCVEPIAPKRTEEAVELRRLPLDDSSIRWQARLVRLLRAG